MIEIKSRLRKEDPISIPNGSLIVLDSFSRPRGIYGLAGGFTPHGRYVEGRLEQIVGNAAIQKVDLEVVAEKNVGDKFVQVLSDLENNLDTSKTHVVSMSAVPKIEVFTQESLERFHKLMESLTRRGVIFVAALDNDQPDSKSIKWPARKSPIYQHSIVVNGFAKQNDQYVPLGADPTLADVTGLADFSIRGDSLEKEERLSSGNSLVAPEVAIAVVLILERLDFLLPDTDTSSTTLDVLSEVRNRVVLALLRSSYSRFDDKLKHVECFDTQKLRELLINYDFSVLKNRISILKKTGNYEYGVKEIEFKPSYDWGADFLPYKFGAGDTVPDLVNRIQKYLQNFQGQKFHFENDRKKYVVEKITTGFKLYYPQNPNSWLVNKLKEKLVLTLEEIVL